MICTYTVADVFQEVTVRARVAIAQTLGLPLTQVSVQWVPLKDEREEGVEPVVHLPQEAVVTDQHKEVIRRVMGTMVVELQYRLGGL